MGKIAFVFPGQGAQHPGMGKDLYENNSTVRKLFDEAEKLRPGILRLMFEGTSEELKKTENTQPCLYLSGLAPAITLMQAGVKPSGVAGFSLGEFPALGFAGAFDLLEGFSLTDKRGRLMGEETHKHDTSMVAVVRLDNETIESVCREFSAVYPVNYNYPGQLVVAGDALQIKEFSKAIRSKGGMALPLKVAGAFHSPFMNAAAEKFADLLAKIVFLETKISVYANRTGKPYQGLVTSILSEQMNHPVLWENTIRRMIDDGFDTFIETGTGKTLSGMISRISSECRVYTAETMDDCMRIAKEVLVNA